MNTKNPFHGRFSLVFIAWLAVGPVACGAAPEAGDGSDDPSAMAVSTSTPPSTEAPEKPARADAGPDAQPASESDDPVQPTQEPSGGAASSNSQDGRAQPQRLQ